MITVNVLLPTLYPKLAERCLRSVMAHGAGPDAMIAPVVVMPHGASQSGIAHPNVTIVPEHEQKGVNAALRLGLRHCTADIIHVTCDDVIYQPGWLDRVMVQWSNVKDMRKGRVIMGVRHSGGIGTAWGRMYANFPMFSRSLLDDQYMKEHFMAEWLKGQWGDVAFSLACWHSGGIVVDSNTSMQIAWADRLGHGEAETKGVASGPDMKAIMDHFGPAFGDGWPTDFRGFNVDCDPRMLVDHTICIPRNASFVEAKRLAPWGR